MTITTRELRVQTLLERRRAIETRKEALKIQGIMTTRDVAVAEALRFSKESEAWRLGVQGNKTNVISILSDGAWRGSRAFLIGGGPSLRGFDFERLQGEKTIAINRAYEVAPFASILFSMDWRFYRWIIQGRLGADAKRKFEEFQGLKLWLDTMNFAYSGVYTIHSIGRNGLSRTLRNGLYHGNNSGYGAINLALILGADPIYLLGFDMKYQREDGKVVSHFHDGYPSRQSEAITLSFIKDFEMIGKFLAPFRSRIINLNPDSAIRVFPKMTIGEVLSC